MKRLKELLKQSKRSLSEMARKVQIGGSTWVVPQTVADVVQLRQVVDKWIQPPDFTNDMYVAFGDSLLLDALDKIREPNAARKVVGKAIERLLKTGKLTDPAVIAELEDLVSELV